jgi:hypothetical protein
MVVLLFVPTAYSFYVGQVNAFVLLLLALCYHFLERRSEFAAGICLGIAILLKVAPVVLVFYLIYRRSVSAVLATATMLVTAFLLTTPASIHYLPIYLSSVLPTLMRPQPHPVNQSLNGFFSRLLVSSPYSVPLHQSPELARYLSAGTSLLLLGFVVVVMLRQRARTDPRIRNPAFFGLAITASAIASPLAWESLYILLAFSIVLAVVQWRMFSRMQKGMAMMAFCLFTIQRLWDPFVNAPELFPGLRHLPLLMSLGLFGALILLLLQLQLAINTSAYSRLSEHNTAET